MKRVIVLFASIFLMIPALRAQTPAHQDINYWNRTEEMLADQAQMAYRIIDRILTENPPSEGNTLIRASAMANLDVLLHDTRVDNVPAFYSFIRSRIDRAIEGLNQPVASGMMIYKLYNHTFVVKTPTVTIAFDLYRGGPRNGEFYITEAQMQAIADKCDIMFITHEHRDHADPEIAAMFTRAGKDVVVPPGLWSDNTNLKLTPLRGETLLRHDIKLLNGQVLKVAVWVGHQSNLINNVYVVTTPEGISVAHTGDQYNNEDLAWVRTVKDETPVDVMLVNCWTAPLYDMIAGFAPKLVVPGHENEMNHSIDHRESTWMTVMRMQNTPGDKLYMTWGEKFHYTGK